MCRSIKQLRRSDEAATTGEIEAFEVGGGRVAGLVQRADGAGGHPFTIGTDAVIVSDESAVIPQDRRH